LLLLARAGLWDNAKRCPQSVTRKLPEKNYRDLTNGLCWKVTVDFLRKVLESDRGGCWKVTVDKLLFPQGLCTPVIF
jgi:hypothetical protein